MIICCIPARYGSTRLCGKPLLMFNDKTMIQCVYKQVAQLSDILDEIVVLTDDERIQSSVQMIDGKCAIITEPCLNGTERICRYLSKLSDTSVDVVVNVQGDEPFINPSHIRQVILDYHKYKLLDPLMMCSTLHYETRNLKEIENKSRGKMVLDENSNIMYCSRNIIPVNKQQLPVADYDYKIHVGVFVFDKNYLMEHYNNNNTPLQLCEDIEWLKIIEQGYHIHSTKITEHEIGVDTLEDYKYLLAKYS